MNGGMDYLNYKDLQQALGFLVAEYNIVKACLLKLITLNLEVGIVLLGSDDCFVQDTDIIAELLDYGYKIDTTNSQRYAETINNSLRRVENLQVRMKLNREELEVIMGSNEGDPVTYDSIMAFLYSQFPHVPEDITLSRYNEMMKVLKNKHSTKTKQTTEED